METTSFAIAKRKATERNWYIYNSKEVKSPQCVVIYQYSSSSEFTEEDEAKVLAFIIEDWKVYETKHGQARKIAAQMLDLGMKFHKGIVNPFTRYFTMTTN